MSGIVPRACSSQDIVRSLTSDRAIVRCVAHCLGKSSSSSCSLSWALCGCKSTQVIHIGSCEGRQISHVIRFCLISIYLLYGQATGQEKSWFQKGAACSCSFDTRPSLMVALDARIVTATPCTQVGERWVLKFFGLCLWGPMSQIRRALWLCALQLVLSAVA